MNDQTHSSGYAPVNGLNMYYEIHGAGRPLVLIHPGFGSTGQLGPILPAMAKSRQVIAVDLQGHGRTADIDRPLSFEFMGDDIAELITHLELDQPDVMGYSFGGCVAMHTAFRSPDRLRKLVVVSSPYKWVGWYPETLAAFSTFGARSVEMLKATPLYEVYSSVAPNPEDWTTLHDKYRGVLDANYDWTDQVSEIKIPTMLAFADADAVSAAHTVEFFALLGGGLRDGGIDGSQMPASRLAILPGFTHYNVTTSPHLPEMVNAFLDED